MMASSLSITGAVFTLVSLTHGSFWGKPTWGTWWAWDARITSTLILFFLYIGFISLQSAIDDPRRADRAGAVLAMVGVINVTDHLFLGCSGGTPCIRGLQSDCWEKPKMTGPMLAAMFIHAGRLLALFDSCSFDSAAVYYLGKRTKRRLDG
jgi:heme exporter protein C